MDRHVGIYGALVRLYPAAFRREYRDDLVQVFADLITDEGPARAWRCTTLDLIVTVPRYRLERVMSPRQSTSSLYVIIALLATAGFLSIGIGVYVGAVLLLVAIIVAVSQRSRLARSMRTPDPARRRHLLVASAVLAITCVISTTIFWFDLMGDEHWGGGKLLVYNAVFFFTAIGALGCLIAGLSTPRGRAVTR